MLFHLSMLQAIISIDGTRGFSKDRKLFFFKQVFREPSSPIILEPAENQNRRLQL